MRSRQRIPDKAEEPGTQSASSDDLAVRSSSASFKQNLSYFQKAAQNLSREMVVKGGGSGGRKSSEKRAAPRRSSVSSDESSTPSADGRDVEEENFEPVLFVNGRPRYVTSEAAGGGGGGTVDGGPASQLGETGGGAGRTERGAQKVRIGGTAAERIRAGSRSADRSASKSPSRNSVNNWEYEQASKPAKPSAPRERERSSSQRDLQPSQPVEEVQPPRRKPYIRFNSVENNLSHDDLTYFKQTIGIIPGGGGGIQRTQSCNEGLNLPARPPAVARTLSFSSLAEVGAAERRDLSDSRGSLRRVPSVDEILESVKVLRARRQQESVMVKTSEPEAEYQNLGSGAGDSAKKAAKPSRQAPWSGVKFSGPSRDDPDEGYEHVPDDICYENVSNSVQAVYENTQVKSEVIYDQPVKSRRKHRSKSKQSDSAASGAAAGDEPQQHYENMQFSDTTPQTEYQNLQNSGTGSRHPTYMNLHEPETVYENVEKGPVSVTGNGFVASAQYDVPRAATHIYDSPQKTRVKNVPTVESGEYDTPRPTYGKGQGQGQSLLPRATQIVLHGEVTRGQVSEQHDCDRDSLEGDSYRRPDIPSPDYGSEEEDVDGIPNDYIGDDQLDEGLGESDARSYYNEDPGLEVILEEPEDEYVTSSEEEEEPSHQSRSLRSLDGSEGIGSAEGDSGSNASVGSSSGVHSAGGSPTLRPDDDKEERIQRDRCVEVYPETMRQRKPGKKVPKQVDIKQWDETKEKTSSAPTGRQENGTKPVESPSKIKKLLPSVKALKSQFESAPVPGGQQESQSRTSRSRSGSKEKSTAPAVPGGRPTPTAPPPSGDRQKHGEVGGSGAASAVHPGVQKKVYIPDDPVDAIYDKFGEVDERLMKPKITTLNWDPTSLVSRLYEIQQPARRPAGQEKGYVNIEGWLEKLPSGRKKATFWNAWKRRYFKAKDGFLYYYQNNTTEKPSMVLQLMGGNVEVMDSSVIGVDDGVPVTVPMIGIDDGKGRYVVVRCSTRQEADRWTAALLSHTVEDYHATYVQPVPLTPAAAAASRRCLVIDLGSSSIRAGLLHAQPTLPQVFFPAVMTSSRDGKQLTFGGEALRPESRAAGVLSFPLRPSNKITKYSADLPALKGLLQLVFQQLRVHPADFDIQLSLPRSFNTATLGEILRLMFDTFGARGVNLTHQSILAMWSYNATSGVVVDIGDRMDVVPVIDGYIVEGGVSRVPYGGVRIQDHLRHFLHQKHYSLDTEVESLVIRHVLERLCYVAEHYSSELQRFSADPASLERSVSLREFLGDNVPWKRIELDSGRFQATEGLFSPEAWGLDNKGVHRLVQKAVQECSMDIRKEMVKSIYLAGGVTLLPGFAERLQIEMDKLTPPTVTPKVHASPYRYHASYLGACVLAGSDGFQQAKVSRDSWLQLGTSALKKWTV